MVSVYLTYQARQRLQNLRRFRRHNCSAALEPIDHDRPDIRRFRQLHLVQTTAFANLPQREQPIPIDVDHFERGQHLRVLLINGLPRRRLYEISHLCFSLQIVTQYALLREIKQFCLSGVLQCSNRFPLNYGWDISGMFSIDTPEFLI